MLNIKTINRTKPIKKSRYNFLRLDKNERISRFQNSFIKKFKSRIKSEHLTCYPELFNFYKKLSKEHKLKSDFFIATSGIDQAIKMVIETFSNNRKKILIIDPTFAMIKIYCDALKKKKKIINFSSDINLKKKDILDKLNKNISLFILSNPNSPTGSIIIKKDLISIIKKAKLNKTVVAIDEAYFGFNNYSAINFVKKFNNLIIMRTFSKAYGLAGLRLGYITSQIKNIRLLKSIKPMYESNSLALLAANMLLENPKIKNLYTYETKKTKLNLISHLEKFNIEYKNTYTNFLLINFKKQTKKIFDLAKKKKILIVSKNKNNILKKYTRVSLGPSMQFDKFLKIIKNVYKKK